MIEKIREGAKEGKQQTVSISENLTSRVKCVSQNETRELTFSALTYRSEQERNQKQIKRSNITLSATQRSSKSMHR